MKTFRIPKAEPTRSARNIDADLAALAAIIEHRVEDLSREEVAILETIQRRALPEDTVAQIGPAQVDDDDQEEDD